MRGLHVFVFLALTALPQSVTAGSCHLNPLAEKCSRQDERSCKRIIKEIQHCKNVQESSGVLPFLPDSALVAISEDSKIEPSVVNSANNALKQRRAMREQRRANFSRLHAGMTIREVEGIVGLLNADTSFGSIHLSDFAVQVGQVEGELHYTLRIRGRLAESNFLMVQGGSIEKSVFSWDSDECLLNFDYEGKLTEFAYRGGP